LGRDPVVGRFCQRGRTCTGDLMACNADVFGSVPFGHQNKEDADGDNGAQDEPKEHPRRRRG
jgi:hypothetical protein